MEESIYPNSDRVLISPGRPVIILAPSMRGRGRGSGFLQLMLHLVKKNGGDASKDRPDVDIYESLVLFETGIGSQGGITTIAYSICSYYLHILRRRWGSHWLELK